MEEKESDLSCGMKSSGPTSADISYTSSCSTYVLHIATKYLDMSMTSMSSLTILNSLKSKEKQWWPGRSVHTAIMFLKSEKSV